MPRKLIDIFLTGAIGVCTGFGGIEGVARSFNELSRFSPQLEKYTGLIGYNAVQYGIPAIIGLGALGFTCIAIKATDKYLSEKRQNYIS